MARLRRRRRILKWAGLVASLLIGVAWMISLTRSWWYAWDTEYLGRTTGPVGSGGYWVSVDFIVSLSKGCLVFGRGNYSLPARGSSSGWMGSSLVPAGDLYGRVGNAWQISLPLLVLLAFTSIPTAFLWWLDRRRIAPGHCQKCGYNLTGNTSGICPECGEKVSQERSA